MSYAIRDWRNPTVDLNVIPKRDRRGRYSREKTSRKQPILEQLKKDVFVVVISFGLMFALGSIYTTTYPSVAHGADTIRYQDVHDEKTLCAFIKQHPGHVVNPPNCL